MSEASERSALEQIVELFASHGVEFLIIGGQAESLFQLKAIKRFRDEGEAAPKE